MYRLNIIKRAQQIRFKVSLMDRDVSLAENRWVS